MEILKSFSCLSERYDIFLFDLWGVTHNGLTPFPGVLNIFSHLREKEKVIVFLSNAPRPLDSSMKRLEEMGINRSFYHGIHTSGQACRDHLRTRPNDFYQSLGKRLYHLGPDQDHLLYEGLPYEPVNDILLADFVLVTGTQEGQHTTVQDHDEFLNRALDRNLPLICANADKIAMYGETPIVCAGAIASEYQKMGGRIFQHGKPNVAGYNSAHSLANTFWREPADKSRVLMVGDSLETDISGANAYGIDSLMLISGIHKKELSLFSSLEIFSQRLDELCTTYQAKPTYVMEELHW